MIGRTGTESRQLLWVEALCAFPLLSCLPVSGVIHCFVEGRVRFTHPMNLFPILVFDGSFPGVDAEFLNSHCSGVFPFVDHVTEVRSVSAIRLQRLGGWESRFLFPITIHRFAMHFY